MRIWRLGLTSVAVLACVGVRPGPEPVTRLLALLARMDGEFTIEARMFPDGRGEPRRMTGTASFASAFMGRYWRERFTLNVPGRTISGEAYLGPIDAEHHFELVQVDEFSSSMFHVAGAWNPSNETIELAQILPQHDVPGLRRRPLRWIYRFGEGDSFVKEMHRQRADGSWVLASDYRYLPRR